jgi:RsiW-degrading membrane proteinase PrsW (M82 family)
MNGILVLFLLSLIAVAPIIPLYIWFRIRRFGTLPFLLALGTGFVTVFVAALGHYFFTPLSEQDGMGALVLGVLRISLIEELSRLLCLYLLLRFCSVARIQAQTEPQQIGPTVPASFFGTPSGMAAGLGFAAAENIFYSVSNPGAALWRIFTAALHAACGARIGTALSVGMGPNRKQTLAGFSMILAAILIHAMYNFSVLNPRVPDIIPALLALTSLASSVLTMCMASPKRS